jgi:hypothetical protein
MCHKFRKFLLKIKKGVHPTSFWKNIPLFAVLKYCFRKPLTKSTTIYEKYFAFFPTGNNSLSNHNIIPTDFSIKLLLL